MNTAFLRTDTLELGPDVGEWPIERQIAAAVALLRADEQADSKYRPSWLADCLSEAAAGRAWREFVLQGLADPDIVSGGMTIMSAIRTAVLEGCRDYLTEQARAQEDLWRAEHELEEYTAELERREDARREESDELWWACRGAGCAGDPPEGAR